MTNVIETGIVRDRRARLIDTVKIRLAAAAVFGLAACVLCLSCERENRASKNCVPSCKCIAECRICIVPWIWPESEPEPYAEVCLSGEVTMDDLVLEPMRLAKRDPHPAEYADVGTLTIVFPDESREHVGLYSPWGYYSRGGVDFITDFDELQVACNKALREADDLLSGVRGKVFQRVDDQSPNGSTAWVGGKDCRVAECRISIAPGSGAKPYTQVCLRDESLVNDLVLEPMRLAKFDPNPAEHATLGTLTIVFCDESRESLYLYFPWGVYSRGGKYFVADFEELQMACEKAVRESVNLIVTVRRK